MSVRSILAVGVFLFFTILSFAQDVNLSFLNPELPLDERAQILVSQMTNEEKISQLMNASPAIPRLQIKAYNWWNEALHGIARNGKATIFPQAIGLAATFDTNLAYRVADAISTEARSKFNIAQKMGNYGKYAGLTFWTPNINIFRDPRWGRGQETYGEDPLLTAKMGVAFVKGLQGDDEDYLKSAACAKHFAVHSGPEESRHHFNAVASKKDFNETYLPAFEALVIDANVEGVMGAYNAVYGIPACASPLLLTEILRGKWGFDGYVTSDCGALGGIAWKHKYVKTAPEAAAAALKAGTNLNCGGTYQHLDKALEKGVITEELLNLRTKELLMTRFRLGLLDREDVSPYANYGPENIHCEAHVELARTVAQKSIVLLKNKNNVLPLSTDVKVPYVTGPFANSADMLMGNYYGVSPNLVTILEGITDAVSLGTSLNYRSGALPFQKNINPKNWAPNVARESDVTICVVGITADMEGEEVDAIASDNIGDRKNLKLPDNQINYLKEIIEAKGDKPLILVVASGSPVSLEGIEEHCDAILHIWYPGEQGGNAVGDVIFGKVAPSGKLPITFPKNVNQLPDYEDYSMQGRTYKFMKKEPMFPFGFGLSYTAFVYGDVIINKNKIKQKDDVTISCMVSNAGEVDADEVVQLYLQPMVEIPEGAQFILKAFKRIHLKAGESVKVEFTLPSSEFKQYDMEGELNWVKGDYQLIIGGALPTRRSLDLGAATPIKTHIQLK